MFMRLVLSREPAQRFLGFFDIIEREPSRFDQPCHHRLRATAEQR
jgi:hypothetical protein